MGGGTIHIFFIYPKKISDPAVPGFLKHPYGRFCFFFLNVLVYIRLVKLVLQHATYISPVSLKTDLGP